MSRYHWINHVRDRNGNIIACIIEDKETKKEIQVKKDELKIIIEKYKIKYPDSDLIDNLTLTKDKKLWVRDNIIDEYIKACQIFGIEPLQIEKIGNIYVVVDIPNNMRNIQIPKFVNGIKLIKDFKILRCQSQEYNMNTISNNDREVKLSLEEVKKAVSIQLKMQKDNLELNNEQKILLEEIIDKITKSNVRQAKVDVDIQGRLLDLHNTIAELENISNNSEILEQIGYLKNEIKENGQRLFELENKITPKLKELVQQYNLAVSDDMFETCKATDAKNIPLNEYGYVNKKNYSLKDEETYINKMNDYGINDYLSFNMVQSLKPLVEYTYNSLVAMKNMFDGINSDTLKEIAEFKGQAKWLNNSVSAIKVTGQTTFGVQVESGVNLTKATALELFKRSKQSNLIKKFKKIYTHPDNIMQEFYDETDKDIAIYLIEYMINTDREYKNVLRKIRVGNKLVDLEYFDLIKLIHKEMETKTSNKVTEEQAIRIATAYISARKVMSGNDIDLDTVISFKGEYTPEQLDRNNEQYIGDEASRNYKEDCENLFLKLIKAALVLEYLNPKFAEIRVVEPLKEIRAKLKKVKI